MNNMVDKNISFQILSFGPLVETFGERQTEHNVKEGTTIREFILSVDMEKWIGFGLSVAKNGERCSLDDIIGEDDEIALLPPMSGG